MNGSATMKRFLAVLCAGFLFMSATAPAQAALVGTDKVLAEAQSEVDRAQLLEMLDRDAVRSKLESMGVDPADARARVERMTDQEVAQLQGRIDEAVAGGDALSVVLFVFVVFVITDVIGATDIFPFINSVD